MSYPILHNNRPRIIAGFFCLLPILIPGLSAIAQDYQPHVKYGKVDISDFEVTDSVIRPDDNAVVLADVGSSKMQISIQGSAEIVHDRHTRIKILNADGLSEADRLIVLYVDGHDQEKLSKLNACVHNIENGKVHTEKLRNREWSTEKYDENHHVVRFSLPSVKVGSIVEIEYRIYNPFIFRMPTWDFQTDIPVLYSEYWIYHPELVGYKMLKLGYHPLSKTDRGVEPPNMASSANAGYRRAYYQFVAENVPGFRRENLMDASENYIARIVSELGYIHYEAKPTKFFYKDWPTSVKDFLNEKEVDHFLNPPNRLQSSFELSDSLNSDLERAEHLYYQLQRHLKRSEDRNVIKPEQKPIEIYERGQATDNETNWLLVQALKQIGLESYLVLANSRSERIALEAFPIFSQFHDCLASVLIDSTIYLLDASDDHMAFGQLPENMHNGEGLLLRESNPIWVPLHSLQRTSALCHINLLEYAQGFFEGKMQVRYTGIEAERIRQKAAKSKDLKDAIGFPDDWTVVTIESDDFSDRAENKDVVNASFEIKVPAEVSGSNVYLPAVLLSHFVDNPLKSSNRKYPVNYPTDWSEAYSCSVSLPESLKLQTPPETVRASLPNNDGIFLFDAQSLSNQLIISSKINLNKSFYGLDEYPALRHLYDMVSTSHGSFIEFVKE